MPSPAASPSFARRLGVLWTLYFVQGLPFGFQATALPVYLRDAGVSLAGIGFATALALPWSLKPLWAPLVDRFGSSRFGRRRSWIVPLQAALAATCFGAALLTHDRVSPLLALVLLMNLFAATMDIAVDGLAIDLLPESELGQGNIAQVVGYKAGMLTGGGLLVWASGRIGWEGLFLAMSGLVALSLLVTLAWRERAHGWPHAAGSPHQHPRLREVLGALREALARPGAGWLILFVGTYKLGETMADTMFKPFLFDAGFGREQIGLWVGTWGMLFSIVGSFAGGLLAGRIGLYRALVVTTLLRVIPVAGEWWLSVVVPTPERVLTVTCAEHLFGGALTTAMFAFMMSRVDRRIGATHYTVLAAIEVWGKLPSGWASGVVTQASSYAVLFALATVLSLAFCVLLVPLRRSVGSGLGPPAAANATRAG